jgi:D-lyxose ketol-isomerase
MSYFKNVKDIMYFFELNTQIINMKRSTVNQAVKDAIQFFKKHHWYLPPDPRWDVTDFGLGHFEQYGLVLVNLAEENEYCEKLMYARKGMTTPCHSHIKKREDIIVRNGKLAIQVWKGRPSKSVSDEKFPIKINGMVENVYSGDILTLESGQRITLEPGIYHEFYPLTDECIIGEVSTANDDLQDNLFIDPDIGRFSKIIEDEPPLVKLVSDR